MNKLALFSAVGAAVMVSACGSSPTIVTTTTGAMSSDSTTAVEESLPPASDQPTTSAAQMANPASVFCVQQGGTVEIVDEADGQIGYCNLPDGTRIEEWEYYRSQNPDAPGIESELPGDGVD